MKAIRLLLIIFFPHLAIWMQRRVMKQMRQSIRDIQKEGIKIIQ